MSYIIDDQMIRTVIHYDYKRLILVVSGTVICSCYNMSCPRQLTPYSVKNLEIVNVNSLFYVQKKEVLCEMCRSVCYTVACSFMSIKLIRKKLHLK